MVESLSPLFRGTEAATGTSSRAGGSPQTASGIVEVRVERASDIDHALTEAITQVRDAATMHHVGIMVTRLDAGWYIVRAHPEVPFGFTRQQH